MALYGSGFPYRGAIYRGDAVSQEPTTEAVGELDEFVILIYDRDGVLKQRLTNKVGRGTVTKLEFSLLESGPGNLKLTCDSALTDISYNYKIEVKLYGTNWVWYAGYINKLPSENQRLGPYNYAASGYWSIFKNVVVLDKTYTSTSIKLILDDLLDDITTRTGIDVRYWPEMISPSAYSVPQINFEGVSVQEALNQLGEIAKNHIVGVDENNYFFFLPRDFSVQKDFILMESRDYSSDTLHGDVSKIINKVYPKTGKIINGSNILSPISDATSINAYGLREEVVDVPSIFASGDDATDMSERWAEGFLYEHKEPRVKGSVKNVKQKLNRPLKPKGKLRLIQQDGTTIEGLVKEVKYRITNRLEITIKVGWPNNALTNLFVKIQRTAEYNSALIEMNASQV